MEKVGRMEKGGGLERAGFWLARHLSHTHGLWLHVAADGPDAQILQEIMGFCRPEYVCRILPAWDCGPYDRLSPSKSILAQRAAVLLDLKGADFSRPHLCLVTANGLLQKIPDLAGLHDQIRFHRQDTVPRTTLFAALEAFGFERHDLVREPGDYAVRGSLVDVFPAGSSHPLRLDFFGDALESLKAFDPLTQRTFGDSTDALTLGPLSEWVLTPPSIQRFRQQYRARFPEAREGEDPLYTALSQGRKYPGMEHWLPLITPVVPLWRGLKAQGVSFGPQLRGQLQQVEARIQDNYAARQGMLVGQSRADSATPGSATYRPLPPEELYETSQEFTTWTQGVKTLTLPQIAPLPNSRPSHTPLLTADSLPSRLFLTAQTPDGLERMKNWVCEREVSFQQVTSWAELQALDTRVVGLGVLPLSTGFYEDGITLATEHDLFGVPKGRPTKRSRDARRALQSMTVFEQGDYVVHEDHGIGRYEGLEGIGVNGVIHDCLHLTYAEDAKLYVPAENMNLISRYGSADMPVTLDKLGMSHWQNRKARIQKRIQIVAEDLLKIAAKRLVEHGPACDAACVGDTFEAFCAAFPYPETEDQLRAVEEIATDLGGDHPMDRLLCGDVGFGKTEVALRAAYLVAASGYQVAVIVPTTLLARQHYQNFQKRFSNTPYNVGLICRLVSRKDADTVRQRLEDASLQIVVATHSIVKSAPAFANLGLVIVDEEQHFGVAQKEKLKQLTPHVHVLSLSATPIPRTLQMALLGVRQMSTITTPPLGRTAVQTFCMPFDPLTVCQAISRELQRGGKVFYVCPRVEHLEKSRTLLQEMLPQLKIGLAHGQLPSSQLEDIMTGFEDGHFDLLLSTNIVESGLDIATANTLIVHRADLLGLGQLYQLRGRVGRGNIQGYAYLTFPPNGSLSVGAQRRLDVMQSLDYLGAGFAVASHDAEIRGVGNLVGEEQSGHIREVGVELYQHMLEEALAQLKNTSSHDTSVIPHGWTPSIHFPRTCIIPESYVEDGNLRLSLYKDLSALKNDGEVDGFRAELVDRFGPVPPDVDNLLKVVTLKVLCQHAGVEKLEIGEKGAVLTFRQTPYHNPETLVRVLSQGLYPCRLSPDQKVRFLHEMATDTGLTRLQQFLAALGQGGVFPVRPCG